MDTNTCGRGSSTCFKSVAIFELFPFYLASTYLVLSLGLVFFDNFNRETHAALLVLEVLRRALRKWELAVNFFVRI